MKKNLLILFIFTVILLIFSSCNNPEKISIPLLVSDIDGNVRKANWDVNNKDITYDDNILFKANDLIKDVGFYWDGGNRIISSKESLDIYSNKLNVDIFRGGRNSLLHYKDTKLEQVKTLEFKFETGKEFYTFNLKKLENSFDNKVELSNYAISSYIVKDNKLYILFNGFSLEKNTIELLLATIDYKKGNSELELVDDCITLSPANPPAMMNVLQTDEGFIVFNSNEVALIDLENNKCRVIVKNDIIVDDNDKHPLFDKIGIYNDFLIVRGYRQSLTSDKNNYKLYLIKNSEVLSEIDITEYSYIPNYIKP